MIFLCSTVALLGARTPVWAQASPALPQEFLHTTYAPPTGGKTIVVAARGDFQAALNSAQPGDIIELAAGETFTGPFTLPNKTGTGWIYIRSSAHASLPPPGARVSPSDAGLMPKLKTTLPVAFTPSTTGTFGEPAITTAPGAHHYRFVGIEITTDYSERTNRVGHLVALGSGRETSELDLPSDIVFDRCYIHGTPTGNVMRGIALGGARSAVIDSYLSDLHDIAHDSQAIIGWNGPGPFKIVNNYLEAASQTVMFGDDFSRFVPSDIEIRHNHFFKPLTWKADHPTFAGIRWVVKNFLELKNARRVLVEGNILENNWGGDGSDGMGILFVPRPVEDVTVWKNVLRNSGGGFTIDPRSSIAPPSRILIRDNLLDRIDNRFFRLPTVDFGGDPEPPGGIVDLIVDHNTARFSGVVSEPTAVFMGGPSQEADDRHQNLTFRNNLFQRGAFGVIGSGVGEGTVTLNTYASAWTFKKNVIIGAPASIYPSDPSNPEQNNQICSPTGTTCFPATDDHVGFVDWRNGDYRLTPTSPYNDAGSDGKDIGADIDAIMAATAGVVSGSPPPSEPPPLGQSPFTGTPFAVPGLFEAEDFDLGGEGVAYHDNVLGNAGDLYRTSEDVDIIAATGNATGFVVNNIETGEWIEYTINVTAAGTYRIEPHISSEFADSRFHVEIDGVNVSGSILVPNTGWWGAFQLVPTGDVSLSAGEHILRIHSDQQYFNLDAIQISSSTSEAPPPSTVTRFEETDLSIAYTAGWNHGDTSRPWSGGTATFSASTGAQATFTFTGTAVDWISLRGTVAGIARVFLDGTFVAEVDLFAPTEEVPVVVFTVSDLARGSHTLMIEVTGRKNPSATHVNVAIDAFDVTP